MMTACFSVDSKLSNMLYPSLIWILSLLTLSQTENVPNLDPNCLACICVASTSCDWKYPCKAGHCGPFYINRAYWEEADNINLNRHDEDYESCVRDYKCAAKVVSNYMAKAGRDCNGDGIVDCDDYVRLHFYGKSKCDQNIQNTTYYDRYIACMPVKLIEVLNGK